MVIEVKKGMTPEEIKALLTQKKVVKKGLQKHVGKLKRGLDGLDYQKQVRNEWDLFIRRSARSCFIC